MFRLLVAATTMCMAAALSLVALAGTEIPSPQGSSALDPRPMSLNSVVAPVAPPKPPAPAQRQAVPAPPAPAAKEAKETKPKATTRSLEISYEAQETGYWCGPAAARIALSSSTENLPTQSELAEELGTTENGTDHIRQVTDGLNRQLAGTGKHYVTHDWGSRPFTEAMPRQLWNDVIGNVDEGKAIVANIVAPPGNQPPGYPSSQTIYHYVTIVGYDTTNKTVRISDPARFSGQQDYWISLDQAAALIQPKGYSA